MTQHYSLTVEESPSGWWFATLYAMDGIHNAGRSTRRDAVLAVMLAVLDGAPGVPCVPVENNSAEARENEK